MAPLRYEGDLEIAFKRVRAELSSDPGFRLLEAASPDYLLASSEAEILSCTFCSLKMASATSPSAC